MTKKEEYMVKWILQMVMDRENLLIYNYSILYVRLPSYREGWAYKIYYHCDWRALNTRFKFERDVTRLMFNYLNLYVYFSFADSKEVYLQFRESHLQNQAVLISEHENLKVEDPHREFKHI